MKTPTPAPPTLRTARGRPLPLGISSAHDGLNFALLCRHGTAVTLIIQKLDDNDAPIAEIHFARSSTPAGNPGTAWSTGSPLRGFGTASGWAGRPGAGTASI